MLHHILIAELLFEVSESLRSNLTIDATAILPTVSFFFPYLDFIADVGVLFGPFDHLQWEPSHPSVYSSLQKWVLPVVLPIQLWLCRSRDHDVLPSDTIGWVCHFWFSFRGDLHTPLPLEPLFWCSYSPLSTAPCLPISLLSQPNMGFVTRPGDIQGFGWR